MAIETRDISLPEASTSATENEPVSLGGGSTVNASSSSSPGGHDHHETPSHTPKTLRTRPLSARQERRLVEYIDDKILDLTRNFKKRTHPTTTLPTLPTYLHATQPLFTLILLIPPTAPSQSSLRAELLLRLTGETLASIPGYTSTTLEGLRGLLGWLDGLDRGWEAVLRGEVWDEERGEGVHRDVDADADADVDAGNEGMEENGSNLSTNGDGEWDSDIRPLRGAVSLTERTRLRSLLVAGTERLEEWLESLREEGVGPAAGAETTSDGNTNTDADTGLESAVERLGIEQAFNGLFERTLSAMGELGGEVLNAEGEVVMS